MNGPNKLKRYITVGRKSLKLGEHSSLLDPFINCEETEVLWMQLPWLFLQHFIFFTLRNKPNKLKRQFTLGLNGLSEANILAYWAHT